jgi:hypothetical protein
VSFTRGLARRACEQAGGRMSEGLGSRRVVGNGWHERFWSVCTTYGMWEISVMNYLKDVCPHILV